MKMYICIKDDIPVGIAMNSAAHGSLMCHLKYHDFNDRTNYHTWLTKSFKKVTCAVTPAEFAMLKEVSDTIIVTESRLNGQEVAVVLAPRPETDYPEFVSLLKLWK
jgi:peptidyl-tRNA hydrolase